jgi:hypothetical protein
MGRRRTGAATRPVLRRNEKEIAMSRHPVWTIWIDHPCSLGRGSRGVAPIEEAIQQAYGVRITYEGWVWEYHRITLAPTTRILAEAIGKALLVMHLCQIREDLRQPWIGECRFDLTCGDVPPPWVQEYEKVRAARWREEASTREGDQK